MLEYELDIVQRELDDGNRVVFLQCTGTDNFCPANNPRSGESIKANLCSECRARVRLGHAWLRTVSQEQIEVSSFDI